MDRSIDNARADRVMNQGAFRLGAWRLADGFKRVLFLLAMVLAIPAISASADEALAIDPVLDQGVLGEGRNAYRERADASRAEDAYTIFKAYSEKNPKDALPKAHVEAQGQELPLLRNWHIRADGVDLEQPEPRLKDKKKTCMIAKRLCQCWLNAVECGGDRGRLSWYLVVESPARMQLTKQG